MKRGVALILLLTILVLAPAISAESTKIRIQTLPNYEIQATATKSGSTSFSAIDRYMGNASDKGQAEFTLSVGVEFDLIIYIKLNGEKVSQGFDNPTKITGNTPGEVLAVDLFPDWFEPEEWDGVETTNEETNETTDDVIIDELGDEIIVDEGEIEEEVDEEEGKVLGTGFTVFGDEGIISKRILYLIAGIISLAVIAFLILNLIKGLGKKGIKTTTFNEIKKRKIEELKKKIVDDEKRLIDFRSK